MKNFKGVVFLMPAIVCMIAAIVGFETNIPILKDIKLPVLSSEIQGKEVKSAKENHKRRQVEDITKTEKVENVALQSGAYQDGVYTGSAQGFGGIIRVEVTIENGKISSIIVTEHGNETPSYYAMAEKIISQILMKQSPNVDTVSGATYSSNGIKNAVIVALNKAAGKQVVNNEEESIADTKGNRNKKVKGKAADGVFVGTAVCEKFDYTVQLKVKFKNGKAVAITSLKLIHNTDKENIPYCNRAWKPTIKNILKKQSSNVDGVSGATYSSNAIKEAYLNALEKAIAQNEGRKAKQNKAKNKEQKEKKDIGDQIEISDGKIYDGIYEVTVLCSPDENEEFAPYHLTASFEFKNEKLIAITNIKSDAESNKKYYTWALNGKNNQAGILQQLMKNQGIKGLSAVSGATCSSIALKELYIKAVQKAQGKQVTETEGDTSFKLEESTTYNPEAKTIQVSAWVYAVEDEWGEYDFDDYELFVDVTFLNHKLCNISVLDCGDMKNRYYCDMAINGTTKKEGMLSKFLRLGNANADTVSGATCTSEALKEIYDKAIKKYGEVEEK